MLASVNNESYSGYAYTYDGAGRLLRVDPALFDSSALEYSTNTTTAGVEYEYNSANRLSCISTYSTDYALTYDEIGNPLSYYNNSSYTFTWNGRKLATAVKGTDSMSFAYNSDELG